MPGLQVLECDKALIIQCRIGLEGEAPRAVRNIPKGYNTDIRNDTGPIAQR
jgi:hypothetical protein